MCFCCCTTRFAVLIYMIVISALAFIYGIVAISNFGSSTKIYEYLINRIDELEEQKSNSSYYEDDEYNGYFRHNNFLSKNDVNQTRSEKNKRRINYYDSYYNSYVYNGYSKKNVELAKAILDTASVSNIDSLKPRDLKSHGYGLIKSLKGIENGLGVVLFIFPIIFLVIEVVLTIFSCGNKEFTVLSPVVFKSVNVILILCITLSTIFIFLSILYGVLLIVCLVQYLALVGFTDSCAFGIIYGIVYGYYGFYYYIVLSCAFCAVRQKFTLVGSSEQPGPDAKFDLNGNPMAPTVIQTVAIPQAIQVQPQPQQILYPQNNPQNLTYASNNMFQPQSNIMNINSRNYIQPQSQTSLNSKDEFITFNGVTYRRVDDNKPNPIPNPNLNPNPVNENVEIKQNDPNIENKVVQ